MYLRYLLAVPFFNSLISWSRKSFFFELVIFGSYGKGLFQKLWLALNEKSLAQH
jgi:hypothetical protein